MRLLYRQPILLRFCVQVVHSVRFSVPVARSLRKKENLMATRPPDDKTQRPAALHEHPLQEAPPDSPFDDIVRLAALSLSGPRQFTPEQEAALKTLARQTTDQSEAAQGITVQEEARTERDQARNALEMSEIRYRRLFETARDGILILDAQTGKIINANPFMVEMLGYPQDEFVGKELWEIGLLRDKKTSQEAFQRLQQDGYIRYESLPLETRRGERREVEFVSNLYRESGYTVIQCNIRDITERKRAEQQKEELLAETQERADRDPLTNLLNHRAFYKKLDAEAARAQRGNAVFAVVMLDLSGFKFFNTVYGHLQGDEVLRLVAGKLQEVCRPYDTLARFGGDEFALLLPDVSSRSRDKVEARLHEALNGLFYRADDQGTSIPIAVSLGAALFPEASPDCREVLRQADERLLWSKTGGGAEDDAHRVRADTLAQVEGFSMLDALVTAVDNKDRYTCRHSEKVMEFSLLIARELGMNEKALRTIGTAALLHDVGKIGVPDAILRKPGKLTEEEFAAIKQHPTMGTALVSMVTGLEDTLDAVRHHHERWDGDGYPFGLRGNETPLTARLMAVADAYSAMTTDRPYRKGMEPGQALSILEAGAGTQWDPGCVAAFMRAFLRPQSRALAA